jgi:hypothetical protein
MNILPDDLKQKIKYHHENDTGKLQQIVRGLMEPLLQRKELIKNSKQAQEILKKTATMGGNTNVTVWTYWMTVAFIELALMYKIANRKDVEECLDSPVELEMSEIGSGLSTVLKKTKTRILVVCSHVYQDTDDKENGRIPPLFLKQVDGVVKHYNSFVIRGIPNLPVEFDVLANKHIPDKNRIEVPLGHHNIKDLFHSWDDEHLYLNNYDLIWFYNCKSSVPIRYVVERSRNPNQNYCFTLNNSGWEYVFLLDAANASLPRYFVKPEQSLFAACKSFGDPDFDILRKTLKFREEYADLKSLFKSDKFMFFKKDFK